MTDKKPSIEMPVGRLIHHSFFTKDQYVDEKGKKSDPSYKSETAYDPDDIAELEELVIQCAVDEWGEEAVQQYNDGEITSPIHFGDELAEAREKKGKKGDAYAGQMVIRAHTIFNAEGDNEPGGIYVADNTGDELEVTERRKVYRGCYVIVNVTPSAYLMSNRRGVSLYLNGAQFVKDGEKLGGGDKGGLFKNVASDGKGRAARKT